MRKRKKEISENYLERIPVRQEKLRWDQDEQGIVTLHVHNTGFMRKLTQVLLKKPEYSQIHLDENGSFVWPLADGKRNIIEIGELVRTQFGEAAEPLYPRLAKFFQILESYGFISWKEESKS